MVDSNPTDGPSDVEDMPNLLPLGYVLDQVVEICPDTDRSELEKDLRESLEADEIVASFMGMGTMVHEDAAGWWIGSYRRKRSGRPTSVTGDSNVLDDVVDGSEDAGVSPIPGAEEVAEPVVEFVESGKVRVASLYERINAAHPDVDPDSVDTHIRLKLGVLSSSLDVNGIQIKDAEGIEIVTSYVPQTKVAPQAKPAEVTMATMMNVSSIIEGLYKEHGGDKDDLSREVLRHFGMGGTLVPIGDLSLVNVPKNSAEAYMASYKPPTERKTPTATPAVTTAPSITPSVLSPVAPPKEPDDIWRVGAETTLTAPQRDTPLDDFVKSILSVHPGLDAANVRADIDYKLVELGGGHREDYIYAVPNPGTGVAGGNIEIIKRDAADGYLKIFDPAKVIEAPKQRPMTAEGSIAILSAQDFSDSEDYSFILPSEGKFDAIKHAFNEVGGFHPSFEEEAGAVYVIVRPHKLDDAVKYILSNYKLLHEAHDITFDVAKAQARAAQYNLEGVVFELTTAEPAAEPGGAPVKADGLLSRSAALIAGPETFASTSDPASAPGGVPLASLPAASYRARQRRLTFDAVIETYFKGASGIGDIAMVKKYLQEGSLLIRSRGAEKGDMVVADLDSLRAIGKQWKRDRAESKRNYGGGGPKVAPRRDAAEKLPPGMRRCGEPLMRYAKLSLGQSHGIGAVGADTPENRQAADQELKTAFRSFVLYCKQDGIDYLLDGSRTIASSDLTTRLAEFGGRYISGGDVPLPCGEPLIHHLKVIFEQRYGIGKPAEETLEAKQAAKDDVMTALRAFTIYCQKVSGITRAMLLDKEQTVNNAEIKRVLDDFMPKYRAGEIKLKGKK